eukprot:2084061-Prorocentrum_lima.AAC.1
MSESRPMAGCYGYSQPLTEGRESAYQFLSGQASPTSRPCFSTSSSGIRKSNKVVRSIYRPVRPQP